MNYNSFYMSFMVIYMSESTPYNGVEVMYSEQSARFICLEGAVRTEAATFNAEKISRTASHECPYDHRFGDLPEQSEV